MNRSKSNIFFDEEIKNNLTGLFYRNIIKVALKVTYERRDDLLIMTDDLIGLMAKHHISRKEMARRMGVTPKTFALKLKRGIFGSDEIEVMMKTLDIRDPLSIFLRMWSLIKR